MGQAQKEPIFLIFFNQKNIFLKKETELFRINFSADVFMLKQSKYNENSLIIQIIQ